MKMRPVLLLLVASLSLAGAFSFAPTLVCTALISMCGRIWGGGSLIVFWWGIVGGGALDGPRNATSGLLRRGGGAY